MEYANSRRYRSTPVQEMPTWAARSFSCGVVSHVIAYPCHIEQLTCAGFCVICTFFVYFCIYETKGLSLEQVDELYAKIPHAWQSKGFVPTVNFQDVQEVGGKDSRRHTLAELETAAVRRKSTAGGYGEESFTEKV